MADTICYEYNKGLYLNITNRCDCSCTFCLRNDSNGGGYTDNLWLEREPSAEEVLAKIAEFDLESIKEIVFCGYGEPTMRLDTMLEIAAGIKNFCKLPIRLNTNGHASLTHGKDVPPLLEGLFDIISISLNSPHEDEYVKLVRPEGGAEAFHAMLDFATGCSKYIDKVYMTVVATTLPDEDIELARLLAESCGAKLRIREYIG